MPMQATVRDCSASGLAVDTNFCNSYIKYTPNTHPSLPTLYVNINVG